MKAIGFDTGPVISLVTNNLLWILEPLKERFGGEFFITNAVKKELLDRAFKTKRFEFEALQILRLINKGVISVETNSKITETAKQLLFLANHSFRAHNKFIEIVSEAEIETLAADAVLDADATVIDERTTRMLLENPNKLRELMEGKLHTDIKMNEQNVAEFRKSLEDVQVIRSTELITVAYKMELFKEYLPESSEIIKNPKELLLDALLWAVKIRGCAVSGKEIERIIRLEL